MMPYYYPKVYRLLDDLFDNWISEDQRGKRLLLESEKSWKRIIIEGYSLNLIRNYLSNRKPYSSAIHLKIREVINDYDLLKK